MAERMRAAGAGITGFYTPTGADTLLAEGRETREIGGRLCLLEYPLPGDVALIEAWCADRWGNLTYRDSARNFNPVMAMAATLTIAMTRNVAALGEISPETVVTPGIFVDRVLHVPPERNSDGGLRISPLDRNGMAERARATFPKAGWSISASAFRRMVADFVPIDREVIFHAENGVIGVGPAPAPDKVNPFLINASTTHVTLRTGGCYVHHADSFAIARGGHLDLCVLGAFEVAENGDIANWARSADEPVKQVGGAMDLAIGAQAAVGGDGAHHQGRRTAPAAPLHVSADREGRGDARLYQSCGARCDAARLRRAGHDSRHDVGEHLQARTEAETSFPIRRRNWR